MTEIKCINCDVSNSISTISENWRCGECDFVNYGVDIDILYSEYEHLKSQYTDIADRLRLRDDEIFRLCRLLDEAGIDYGT